MNFRVRCPTDRGRFCLQSHALLVLRLADSTREVARSAVPVRERLEIGLPPGLPQTWLRGALREIWRLAPDAAVTFIDASSAE